jgi:hypothetical protein
MRRPVSAATAVLLALSLRPAWAGEEYPTPVARPIVSSPSANDRGTNSNYPLDPKHTVVVMNAGQTQPNSGDAPVQSAASAPLGFFPGAVRPPMALAAMPVMPGG